MAILEDTPFPESTGTWEAIARSRGCHCGLWDTNPRALEAEGLPPGACGFCDVCRKPGHTRHHPGPVPFTGAWCDECFRDLARGRPLASWVHAIVILAASCAFGRFVAQLVAWFP